jgi:hypothetical protein
VIKSASQIGNEVMEKLSSPLARFIRSAKPEDLLRYSEEIYGSAPVTYAKSFQLNRAMKALRDNAGDINPEAREELLKRLRHRLNIDDTKFDPLLAPRGKRDLGYAKSFAKNVNTPLVRVGHGGTRPELEQLLKRGPNSMLDNYVPAASGRMTNHGVYTHELPHTRMDAYARMRAGAAGGDPAVLEFDVPQGLLANPNMAGGGAEWAVTPDIWKHISNARIRAGVGKVQERA